MASPTPSWTPVTQVEKEAVIEQMERILAHPVFKNSIRSAKFFRYCVEQSFHTGSGPLKERIIGFEVFKRDADYDTNQDSIVRAAASDVRRRIAQYYHEPGHEQELGIDIPPFSYAPEFRLPSGWPVGCGDQHGKTPSTTNTISAERPAFSWLHRRVWQLAAVLGAILIVAVCLLLWRPEFLRSRQAAISGGTGSLAPAGTLLDNFWNPVLSGSSPVLLCVGESQMGSPGVGTAWAGANFGPRNALAIAQIAKFLGRRDKTIRVKESNVATPADIGQGSVVLISGATNDWTLRTTSHLRFHLAGGPEASSVWIEDRKNPAQRAWTIALPGTDAKVDYAIAARFQNPATKNWEVAVAGLGETGTSAAAHCLIDTSCLSQIVNNGPRNWATMNIEAVIETHINGETPSAPRVLAVEFW